jgi:hypothetical protein
MKLYIKYCRPYKNEDDEPPIEEIWSLEDGQKPKRKLADGLTLYVSDVDKDGVSAINERIWDGIE